MDDYCLDEAYWGIIVEQVKGDLWLMDFYDKEYITPDLLAPRDIPLYIRSNHPGEKILAKTIQTDFKEGESIIQLTGTFFEKIGIRSHIYKYGEFPVLPSLGANCLAMPWNIYKIWEADEAARNYARENTRELF
jgi:hypothetical protein